MIRLFLSVVLLCLAQGATAGKRIALTFDDVPRTKGAFLSPDQRTEKLVAALRTAKVRQAAFFINPGRLADPDGVGGEARIASYVAAGHVIANHSWSHPSLHRSTADTFLADIDKAEDWLKGRPGYRPWFRYPYLHEGARDKAKRDAIRAGLSARGLKNGYVTADGSDWHLEQLTVDAVRAGKTIDMAKLRRLYVSSQLSGVAYHDELARLALGRSPAHVLLLHETDLAAMFIGDLVAELRRQGWTIISADEAFRDPIGKIAPDVPFSSGTNIGMIAWQREISPPLWPIWMSTEMVTFEFNRTVAKSEGNAAK